MASFDGGKSASRAGVVRDFCDAVTQLSIANQDQPLWWFTWLASRDRFNSQVFDAYLAAGDGGAPDGTAGSGLTLFAKEAAAAIEAWLTAKLCPVAPSGDAEVVVVAPVSAETLGAGNTPYRDVYFGDLVERLGMRGEKVLFAGIAIGHRRAAIRMLAQRRDIPATSMAHYLRLRDIAVAAWQALTARFRVSDITLPGGGDGCRVIRRDLRRARGQLLSGLLIERAMTRLLAANPKARVIHTYENNPWEHGIDRAAHAANPPRAVTGYLHCSVLPSHLKNYIAREELALRPAPDRIVCTGPAAREIFLGLGAHDPARVEAGCALRGPDIAAITPRRKPPARVKAVLVVLEGLHSMTHLLRFVAEASQTLDRRRILIRAHPVMPLETLLPRAGVRLEPGKLEQSRAADLAEAIAETEAVIYQSSTAAVTALAMGVPLIKVRLPVPFQDDPLLECDALKQVIDRPEALGPALDAMESMSGKVFATELDRARTYLTRYFAPADDDAIACFMANGSAPVPTHPVTET